MKSIRIVLALVTIGWSFGTASADDFTSSSVGESLADRNCAWCHGQSGKGFSTAPRLAGQTRKYIEAQLLGFRYHTRDNPKSQQFMWGAAGQIDAQQAHDLAVYYSALAPSPADDGVERNAGAGQTIYRDGRIESNIPSCVACHGPNAEGIDEIPRLGGLSYRYLKRRLAQWGEGYHLAAKAPMPEIAKSLPAQDIDALASFLSFVK